MDIAGSFLADKLSRGQIKIFRNIDGAGVQITVDCNC